MSQPESDRTPLILVADDTESSRVLLREVLERHGFVVAEVENGALAVEAFGKLRPQFVVLDVMMPEMDGFEACAAIRKVPGGETVPVLILTGLDDLDSIKRAYEVGATDFASKPINWVVLGQRVRYMLRAQKSFDDLRQSEARLAHAQQIARLGNWERDLASGAMRWSEEMYRLFGLSPGSFQPEYAACLERIHPEDREPVAGAVDKALRREAPYSLDLRIVLPDGTTRYVHEQAEVVCDDAGRPVGLTGTTQDISERKQAEEQIRFLAYYDGLTKLPNRTWSMEKLSVALAAARHQGATLAVLFLDLDRFQRINDTLGHSVGDRLLQGVAERLKRCLRSSDGIARGEPMGSSDTVARLGGDEFIMSISDITRGEDAAKVARRILDIFKEPFHIDEREIFVSGTIGISLFPHDGDDAEALLKNADAAMYHAKDAGRGSFQFFSASMNAAAVKRLSLETALRKALEREEFLLHFQPQIDVASGELFGCEALVRWKNPELGLVSPGDFIPLAEETGLILPLGEWVLRAACVQNRAWQDAGFPPLRLSVNISGRQFKQDLIVQAVEKAIEVSRLDPRWLELEITESILMRSAKDTIETLARLKTMGVQISVDDFGTGYSSLSYLSRFPIDTLKIDQSFVRNMAKEPADAAITSAIIAMARTLNLSVIAEGVETEEQRSILKKQGCTQMQGFLFSRPVPAIDFGRLLAERALRGPVAPAASQPPPADAAPAA